MQKTTTIVFVAVSEPSLVAPSVHGEPLSCLTSHLRATAFFLLVVHCIVAPVMLKGFRSRDKQVIQEWQHLQLPLNSCISEETI